MSGNYGGRVRFGCLACRKSKVKCDEAHPICKRCTRQHKDCIYTKKRIAKEGNSGTAVEPSYANSLEEKLSPSYTLVGSLAESHEPLIPTEKYNASESARYPSNVSSDRPVASKESSEKVRSPTLLSTLISENIYICTTIDLLSAHGSQFSLAYFRAEVDLPFISPYDPVNWARFKERLLDLATRNDAVLIATEALQVLHRARRNALAHGKALAARKSAQDAFVVLLRRQNTRDNFECLFVVAFLLTMFEMLLPEETDPGPFACSDSEFVQRLQLWRSDTAAHMSLLIRLAAWILISHAAARRSGNRGLLSLPVRDLLEEIWHSGHSASMIPATKAEEPDMSRLLGLAEPLFTFYLRLQLLSTRVADLSHYHRRRYFGEDQEEVSALMAVLQSEMESHWADRPALLCDQANKLLLHFLCPTASKPLELLAVLCALTYHVELVEIGRNLSAEQAPTAAAKAHLAHIRDILSMILEPHQNGEVRFESHPAFLRHLFMYAIESTTESDSSWAILWMRKIKDPICYSDFFANFAEGLAGEQRRIERRVTTRWWCLRAFGVEPPHL